MKTLLEKFNERYEPEPNTGCWLWTAGWNRKIGYGLMYVRGRGRFGIEYAHRLSYELFNGPLVKGMTIDHLCRVRLCVNPKHLEQVTRGENVLRGIGFAAVNARKTHCDRGHAYSVENSPSWNRKNNRICKACHEISHRKANVNYHLKHKEQRAAYAREYNKKNRAKINARQNARRARLRAERAGTSA